MIECMSLTTSIWLILLNAIVSVCSSNLPCHYFESINITSDIWQDQQQQWQQVQNRTSIIFDDIEFPSNQYAIVDYTEDDGRRNITQPHLRGCLCNLKPCARLCCSNEEITINDETIKSLDSKCREELNQMEDEIDENKSVDFVNLLLTARIINIDYKTCFPFYTEIEMMNVKRKPLDTEMLNSRRYCLTRTDINTRVHMDVSICVTRTDIGKTSPSDSYAILNRIEHIAMIISIPFLIVTMILYIWILSLHRNLYGKCFICYLICQTACFSAEILDYYSSGTITHLKSVVVYLFLCSFQWLNVTAFDAWWNLRSFKSVSKPDKSSERKRLILYMLYALISPFILDAFKMGCDFLKSVKVKEEQAEDLMRATFIGITFTINIVFFVLTTLKIQEVRGEMNHLTSQQDSSCHQRKKNIARGNFQLYFRLFIVMGLSYSVSGLSYMITGKSTFVEWAEIFLSLQGVWIFVLFVLKRRVFQLINERWAENESISSM